VSDIPSMVEQFAAGLLSRRELVWRLTALVATATAADSDVLRAQSRTHTFQALGLNHLALRVTDLDRSQAFYERHLGMTLIPSGPSFPRLMACGPHVLNLFKATQPQMDHVCFTVPSYNPQEAADRLREQGLVPDVEADRVHFLDPDGYKLQVGGPNAGGQRSTDRPAERDLRKPAAQRGD
jgi:catechol 2,3-dioxygenase-like lactoylglutathione lyase family enzyme